MEESLGQSAEENIWVQKKGGKEEVEEFQICDLYSLADTFWKIRYEEIEGACSRLSVMSEMHKIFYRKYYREY
jgi:hypothetical protein